MSTPKRTILLTVAKGMLLPYDRDAEVQLRARGYHLGDVLSAQLHKPRNVKFHRMVHALGQLLISNVDEFGAYDNAHAVLKRLQIEGDIACDVMAIKIPGLGLVEHRTPKSLSFDQMDEAEFAAVYQAFCRHIVTTYWPNLPPEAIEPMAELMRESA